MTYTVILYHCQFAFDYHFDNYKAAHCFFNRAKTGYNHHDTFGMVTEAKLRNNSNGNTINWMPNTIFNLEK